jgi:hypothetical protein
MKIRQRPRQLRRGFSGGQDHRNDGTLPHHELAENRLNLLILPGAKATFPHKHRGGFDPFDLLAKRRLPRSSRPDLLLIQPGPDVVLGQLPRDLANGGLVLAVVAQEDIKDFHFGVLCVHTKAIL